jgi:hypothetical protein
MGTPDNFPTGINNKDEVSNEVRDGRTYDRSVQVGDPGGASEANPKPTRPFIDPNPGSRMLGPEWQKRSRG